MARQIPDPGLGEKYNRKTNRIVNRDGSMNIIRKRSGHSATDIYYYLVKASWGFMILVILLGYLVVNVFFALAYWAVGAEGVEGMDPAIPLFWNLFFFSIQTITTVGYGNLTPGGLGVNIIMSFEAMLGWVWFAFVTSLLFNRFSRPSSAVLFSKCALITPFEGQKSLQFRFTNKHSSIMVEMEIQVLLVLMEKQGEKYRRKYFDLPLKAEKSDFFSLSWPVIHVIDKESPLFEKTSDDLSKQEAEVLVIVKGFDAVSRQNIHAHYSYRHEDFIWGAVFKEMHRVDEEGRIILELDKINETEPVEHSQFVK
jgi:inward rectifier potassium channel